MPLGILGDLWRKEEEEELELELELELLAIERLDTAIKARYGCM